MENEETQIQDQQEHKSHKKTKKHIYIPLIVVAVVLVVIIGALAWLYTGKVTIAKEKIFRSIPLPAAIVDMKFLSAKDVLNRVDLTNKLVEAQGSVQGPTDTESYDQLIEAKKIEALAARRNLSVSKEEIEGEYNNIITQYAKGDTETFGKLLQETYGMTPDQFKDEIVRHELTQSKLALWYNQQENLNTDNYNKIKEFQDKLSKGQSFDDVSREFSEDEGTKDFAGDSGVMPYEDLLPEFQEGLKDSKVGDVKMIASRYGLHLLKILELNNDGENGQKQIHLQQIYLQEAGFTDWAMKEAENLRIIKLLKLT